MRVLEKKGSKGGEDRRNQVGEGKCEGRTRGRGKGIAEFSYGKSSAGKWRAAMRGEGPGSG